MDTKKLRSLFRSKIWPYAPYSGLRSFTAKVEVVESGCWEWTGFRDKAGYGQFTLSRKTWRAHRLSLFWATGECPDGLVTDHLVCSNPICVNPKHLKFVTQAENVLRVPGHIAAINAAKTHCIRGHALQGDNLYIQFKGDTVHRVCKECRKLAQKQWALVHKRIPSERDREYHREYIRRYRLTHPRKDLASYKKDPL